MYAGTNVPKRNDGASYHVSAKPTRSVQSVSDQAKNVTKCAENKNSRPSFGAEASHPDSACHRDAPRNGNQVKVAEIIRRFVSSCMRGE